MKVTVVFLGMDVGDGQSTGGWQDLLLSHFPPSPSAISLFVPTGLTWTTWLVLTAEEAGNENICNFQPLSWEAGKEKSGRRMALGNHLVMSCFDYSVLMK